MILRRLLRNSDSADGSGVVVVKETPQAPTPAVTPQAPASTVAAPTPTATPEVKAEKRDSHVPEKRLSWMILIWSCWRAMTLSQR